MPFPTDLIKFADQRPAKFFLYLLVAVTAVRVLLLFFSEINLGPDEAQYWWWSREIDFGYFSKPPMIAWLIGLTTSLFGNAEWAVRLSSPFIIAGTTWVIFLLARHLYDERTAFWAGVVWMTMPIISMANAILSTDIPLLFCWTLALYAFVRIADGAGLSWAVLLGLAVGFGMLSKYAMIYFPLCAGLAFVLSPYARQALRPIPLLISAAIAFLVFLPNILWNAANEFQTLAHTQDNANWGRDMFNVDELVEFFTAQFGVAGPVIFGALIWGLITLRKRLSASETTSGKELMLLAFALPPVAIICVQAFLAHANANWAMASYPAITILTVRWLLLAGGVRWLQGSTVFAIALALVFMVATTSFALVDALGQSNSVKRVRGWEAQAAEIATYAENYPAIVVDDRELMGHLLYYMKDSGKPIFAWDVNRQVEHHYEAFDRYAPNETDKALLVMKYPEYLYTLVEFDNILDVAFSSADLNVPCPRKYYLYELSGFNSSKGPEDVPKRGPDTFQDRECRPY